MWRNRGFCSCVLFLSLLNITSAQSSGCGSSPCPQPSGLFPVPGDCTAFYNCAFCTPHRQQCGPGTAFDPLLHVCNHINQVDCSGSAAYSQQPNQRQQSGSAGGVAGEDSTQFRTQDDRSGDLIGPRSSFERRYGSAQYDTQSGYNTPTTTPYPYQDNNRYHGYGSSAAQNSQAPARDIYQAGEEVSTADSSAGRYTNNYQHSGIPPSGHYGHHQQDYLKQQEKVPSRNVHQSQESGQNADSRTHHHNSHDHQAVSGRLIDSHHSHHHHNHHQDSQQKHESNSNATDRGTVAVSARSRFTHSHITHHPEAVAYSPNHQIVYDHSHAEHHHDGHIHSDDEPRDSSSNNRGSPQMRRVSPEPTSTTPSSTNTQLNDTADADGGFDLKGRYVANSGFVPSYVRDQMSDNTEPKAGNYGEREYVRSSNQKQESQIKNIQGQTVKPDRYFMEDLGFRDSDSQESPVQLNADDLRHFQQNQAAQGIPYAEASSAVDRQGRSPLVQPGFRTQYRYPAPAAAASPLSPEASSPTASGVVAADQTPDESGPLFVEHKRRRQPQNIQNSPSTSSDTRGRGGSTGGLDASESQAHIVYVSAPALPTPLPLVADEKNKEYHHMGYRFDHDPLRERVKSA